MLSNPDEFRILLKNQYEDFCKQELGIAREQIESIKKQISAPHALIISGLRRAGKSTLLAQIANKFYQANEYYYINFDNERFLDFDAKDFNLLYELLIELFGKKKIFFFDEIQNIEKWESFARRLIDDGFKLYITGSNSTMLSKELGSKLTGRYINLELFPFSFKEFLEFKKINCSIDKDLIDTHNKVILKKAFNEYLLQGGIPAALKYPELPILKQIYDDIIYRDIIARFNLSSDRALRELSFFLMSNISCPTSFNKLKEPLGLKNVSTIKNYSRFLEISWLIFVINIFDPSIKKQQIAAKKIYSIDLGLMREVSFSLENNLGQALENIVFLKLRKNYQEIFYYKTKEGYEIDFFIRKPIKLIQVCWDLSRPETRSRELRALELAMKETKIKEAEIITYEEKSTIKLDSGLIHITPAYEFLLIMQPV